MIERLLVAGANQLLREKSKIVSLLKRCIKVIYIIKFKESTFPCVSTPIFGKGPLVIFSSFGSFMNKGRKASLTPDWNLFGD